MFVLFPFSLLSSGKLSVPPDGQLSLALGRRPGQHVEHIGSTSRFVVVYNDNICTDVILET